MKSLGILHTDFHTGWGGQASRILMLSKELAQRGHRVTIAAPMGELSRRAQEAARTAPGLSVEDGFAFRAPGHAVSFLRDVSRMKALLRRGAFDIVDVHGSQDSWVTGITRALTGMPECLVMTRHNTKRVRTSRPNRLLYGRLIDHLILVDESVRREYAAFLADGTLEASRISVISSAYRADLFHEGIRGGALRRELALPDAAVIIGVAGRLVLDKGHTFLMQAAARLRPRLTGLTLVFAGTGPNEARLRQEAAALGLADAVHFLGFRSDINSVEASFDMAVLPSIGCDASSATIKEAMALGVPVIASDIGGARHIIEDGVTGRVVPPGDPEALETALRAALEDREATGRMARRAQTEVVRRFSISRLADETLEAYRTALARAEAGPAGREAAAVRSRRSA
ncbi:MAG TPA: glycosyltransferase family 4 protein [Candidatus Polarisedimenticolia bacterium]|nr:glycosyltransferase family 4 protein [Candidatus Polarisedimenticolia bacterium]